MSMCTAIVALAMIWALLSGNAGRMFIPLVLGLIVNLLMIVASTQRTALFGLAGAVGLLLFFYRVRGIMLVGIASVCVAGLLGPFVFSRVSEDYLSERVFSLDTSGRANFWALGYREAMRAPILGHGGGAAKYFGKQTLNHTFHQAYRIHRLRLRHRRRGHLPRADHRYLAGSNSTRAP